MSPYRDEPEARRRIRQLEEALGFCLADLERGEARSRNLLTACQILLALVFVLALVATCLRLAESRARVSPAMYRECLRAGGDPTVCMKAVTE